MTLKDSCALARSQIPYPGCRIKWTRKQLIPIIVMMQIYNFTFMSFQNENISPLFNIPNSHVRIHWTRSQVQPIRIELNSCQFCFMTLENTKASSIYSPKPCSMVKGTCCDYLLLRKARKIKAKNTIFMPWKCRQKRSGIRIPYSACSIVASSCKFGSVFVEHTTCQWLLVSF